MNDFVKHVEMYGITAGVLILAAAAFLIFLFVRYAKPYRGL